MLWVNLLRANMRKEYIELKRYLPNTFAMVLTFYFIFLGLFLGIQIVGDPGVKESSTQYLIVSYVFWYLATMVLQHIGAQISSEAMRGTLEQLYMSPLGVWRILVTRLIASILNYLIIISILLLILMLTTGQWLHIDLISTMPILLLTLLSMAGVGFMVAGLSILWKQIGAFLQIIQFILAALVAIPLSISSYLIFLPFVQGIDLIRDIMINQNSISQIGTTSLLLLTANAVSYFFIGIVIFLLCEKIAIKKSLLSHY